MLDFLNCALAGFNAGWAVYWHGRDKAWIAAINAGIAVFCALTAVVA